MEETATGTDPDALDRPRMAAYLRHHLADTGLSPRDLAGPMTLTRFTGGHSNSTYLVQLGALELVLRRPPFGPLPPAAHDVAREYRWLSAMHPVFPLAPRPYVLCEDLDVAGSAFYVMERRQGLVLRHDEPPALVDHPERRREVSEALVDALVGLHAIEIDTNGLSGLGKPHGFVARQVRGWTDRWQRSQTSALPQMDIAADWLAKHLPPEPATPSVVHGDFKLDNVMLDPEALGRVVSVLDWEMAALGDPLVDLGILLAYWMPTAPAGHSDEATPVTTRPGWLTRDEIVERYGRLSGRATTGLAFYEVFATFKIAVVVQQIFHRYVQGATGDPRFARFDGRVAYLAGRAAARIEDAR